MEKDKGGEREEEGGTEARLRSAGDDRRSA